MLDRKRVLRSGTLSQYLCAFLSEMLLSWQALQSSQGVELELGINLDIFPLGVRLNLPQTPLFRYTSVFTSSLDTTLSIICLRIAL